MGKKKRGSEGPFIVYSLKLKDAITLESEICLIHEEELIKVVGIGHSIEERHMQSALNYLISIGRTPIQVVDSSDEYEPIWIITVGKDYLKTLLAPLNTPAK